MRPSRSKAEKGGYTWELGTIAFGDPLEAIGKKAKIRQKARETWKQNGSVKSSKSEYPGRMILQK